MFEFLIVTFKIYIYIALKLFRFRQLFLLEKVLIKLTQSEKSGPFSNGPVFSDWVSLIKIFSIKNNCRNRKSFRAI